MTTLVPESWLQPQSLQDVMLKQAQIGGMQASQARQQELQPLKKRLLELQQQKLQASVSDPLGMGTGDVGQALQLEKVRQMYGEQSPVYQNALQAFQSAQAGKQSLQDYRLALSATAHKRASTPLGKTELEIADIKRGHLPGSAGQIPLDPQQQESMLSEYEAAKEKKLSDADTRKKAIFATNVDKTLESFNPQHLLQYSGPKGAIKMSADRLAGNQDFKNYKVAQTSASLLAKQVRQFYGDSITPGIQQAINNIVNPSTWIDSPDIALAQFNQLQNILRSETQTYKDALRAPRARVAAAPKLEERPKFSEEDIQHTMKLKGWTREKVMQALEAQ